MLIKARKKPIEIEAMQFTYENKNRVYNWICCNHYADFDSENQPVIRIQTLEGVMTANLGDYIICGVAGEYYPCKPEIFEKTYVFEDKDQ
jgi:hypothetical protein